MEHLVWSTFLVLVAVDLAGRPDSCFSSIGRDGLAKPWRVFCPPGQAGPWSGGAMMSGNRCAASPKSSESDERATKQR